eukprot:4838930-Pleurochrysis_carterae.AAC.1
MGGGAQGGDPFVAFGGGGGGRGCAGYDGGSSQPLSGSCGTPQGGGMGGGFGPGAQEGAFGVNNGCGSASSSGGVGSSCFGSNAEAPGVVGYDALRCRVTGKLRAVCLCDQCRYEQPRLAAQSKLQDEAWALQRRQERHAELSAMSGGISARLSQFQQS